MTLLVIFGSLILLLILGVPIGIALGLSALVTFLYTGTMPNDFLAQNLITSIDSFSLLAVPLFILAGDIMGKGGLSDRLMEFANAIVGHKTGGLGIATIFACMIFAAISGSGPATVAAIGTITIPAMVKQGYSKSFATAIVCAGGCIGVIIPPSIPMVMYGVTGSQSIGKLFMGGILPGILIGISLMFVVYVQSKKNGYIGTGKKKSFKEILKITWKAKWALLCPVIIIGGIYAGIFTPTEAAGIAVVYGLIIGFFVYKDLKWSDFPKIFHDSGTTTATIMLIVGAATAFGKALTVEQIPSQITEGLLSASDSPVMILLLINILLIMVGCFMDTTAAIVILTPLLLPVALGIGLDPIHFGIIMVVNLAIGFLTPPFGVNLFVGAGIAGISIWDIVRVIVPLLVALLLCLAIINFVPQLTLLLGK